MTCTYDEVCIINVANTRGEMNWLGNVGLPLILEVIFMNPRGLELQRCKADVHFHHLLLTFV